MDHNDRNKKERKHTYDVSAIDRYAISDSLSDRRQDHESDSSPGRGTMVLRSIYSTICTSRY